MSVPNDQLPRLDIDPRTGLALIDVPNIQALRSIHSKAGIVYWFDSVVSRGALMHPKQRYMMITDQAVYLITVERSIMKRCWLIKDIESLYLDPSVPNRLIIKMSQPPRRANTGTIPIKDPDFIGEFQYVETRDDVIHIIDQVYKYHKKQPVPKETLKGVRPEDVVSTAKQPQWTVKLVDLSSRVSLEQHYPTNIVDPEEEQARELFQNEFERVKANLKMNLSGYRAEDFDAATREIDLYIDMLDDRDREIERLKHLRDTVFDDPNVWAKCPNCSARGTFFFYIICKGLSPFLWNIPRCTFERSGS